MAISFSGNSIRSFSTPANTSFNWFGQTSASLSFLVRVDSATPPSIPGADQCKLAGKSQFDWWTDWIPSNTTGATLRVHIPNSSNTTTAQADLVLAIGVVYLIIITWDGNGSVQTLTVNGVSQTISTFSGATWSGSGAPSPLTIGIQVANPNIAWSMDKLFIVDGYVFTSTDNDNQLAGMDRSLIATGAPWRGLYPMSGTIGQAAQIGDAGLTNSISNNYNFTTATGSGSAVYSAPLVWVPTVAATPYIGPSRQQLFFNPFKSTIDGTTTSPNRLIHTPQVSINGGALQNLGLAWNPSGFPFYSWQLPGGITLGPTDTCDVTVQDAWANTPAGSVGGFSAHRVPNWPGPPAATLSMGWNHAFAPTSSGGLYTIQKNLKYRLGSTAGNRGKITVPGTYTVYSDTGGNGIDGTNFAGPAGNYAVQYDAASPTLAVNWVTLQPATTTVAQLTSGNNPGSAGIGIVKCANFANIAGNGSANVDIRLDFRDPSGPISYSNLVIYGPNDWTYVPGTPTVLNGSDPYALSANYTSRVPANIGSVRHIDSTYGADRPQLPYPEDLHLLTDENYSELAFHQTIIGYTQCSPVDPVATPWVYSPEFPTYTANLSAPITTAPPYGTHEVIQISDAASAPVFIGQTLTKDSEDFRVLSVAGTAVTVYRGSNGTTPATHAAGPISVAGRLSISSVFGVRPDGSIPSARIWQMTTAIPHGLQTGQQMNYSSSSGVGYPTQTWSDGAAFNVQSVVARDSYVTGPNTFFQFVGGPAAGAVLTAPVALTSSTMFCDRRLPTGAGYSHAYVGQMVKHLTGPVQHINVPTDATDDCVWTIARQVRDNSQVGTIKVIEYDNEPWNFGFGSFAYHEIFKNALDPSESDPIIHYARRANQVRNIFVAAFNENGINRGGEIKLGLNCFIFGTDVASYAAYAQSHGFLIDYFMVAPYVSNDQTAYSANIMNSYTDEQIIDCLFHNVVYGPTYNTAIQTQKAAIAAYNTATGHTAQLMAYEAGLEFLIPSYPKAGIGWFTTGDVPTVFLQPDFRQHDCFYNPNVYSFWTMFFGWLQSHGFAMANIYALSHPSGLALWGVYRAFLQQPGYGDGRNGSIDNRLTLAQTGLAHTKASNVNQDQFTVSVGGQALLDWQAAVAGAPPPPPPPSTHSKYVRRGGKRWTRPRS